MPRIQVIQRTQGIRGNVPAGMQPYTSPAASAMEGAGGAAQDFALREQQSLNSVAAQDAASKAAAALTDVRDRARQVPTDQVDAFFKEETAKVRDTAGQGLNSAAQRAFESEWTRALEMAKTGVSVDRRARVRDEHLGTFLSAKDANLQTIGRLPAGDPQALHLEQKTLQGIKELADNGIIDASAAAKAAIEFKGELSGTYAYRDLLTDPEVALERLEDPSYAPYANLDPQVRVKYAHQAKAEAERVADKRMLEDVTGEALAAYQRGGLDAATQVLARIANDESIPIEKRAHLAAAGQALVNVADAEEAGNRARFYSDLSIAVARGTASYADVEAAHESNNISPQQRTTLIKEIDRRDAAVSDAATLRALGEQMYAGTVPLDARIKEHRDAGDAAFNAHLNTWIEAEMSPDQVGIQMLDFVRRTGYVPTALKSQVRGGLRSSDPARVLASADFMARLQQAAPHALADIDDRDLTMGVVLNDLRAAGMTDEEAIREMRTVMDPKNKALAELADIEIKEGKYAKEYLKWMKDDFDGWFGSDFDFNNDMTSTANARSDYKTLFETFYRKTGDVTQARTLAKIRLERKWGVTGAEGTKRLIEYPPETFYAQALPMLDDLPTRIEKDLADTVEAAGATGKYRIEADARTAREASTGRPTYQVLLQNENGEFIPVYGKDGVTPRRWGLDVDKVRAEWEASNDFALPAPEEGLAAARERAGVDDKPKVDPVTEAQRLRARQQANQESLDQNAQQQRSLIDNYQQKWGVR